MIRVLIVDDSVFMRTILSDMIARDPSIDVIGTAVDGLDALKKIEELSPDVVTLDIEMPVLDGIATLERLRSMKNRPKIMMLSTLTTKDADLTRRALHLGADDFMLKPRNIGRVRGIEQELTTKIKQLITISPVRPRKEVSKEPISAENLVVIGSSAGGPPMLDALLSNLPADLNAAVVITQHMPEGFTAALAERLNRISPMPVKEAANGDVLLNGRVLVSKGGYHSVISATLTKEGKRGGRITLSQSPPVHAVRPAVDKTFSSAAKVFGPSVISVILSGMGSDGGEGAEAIKAAGGKNIVVKEDESLVYGMARSALTRKCVDKVVSLRQIPREIVRTINEGERHT